MKGGAFVAVLERAVTMDRSESELVGLTSLIPSRDVITLIGRP